MLSTLSFPLKFQALLVTGLSVFFAQSVGGLELQDGPLSRYGHLDSPTYPRYIHDEGEQPPEWLDNDMEWFNPEIVPETGKTRHYDFTISRALAAPDGYEKEVILINNEFPGPMIEANWGDWIEVTVRNNITEPVEGTALHWHGLLQKETPWYDGVPSVQQCPIAPGADFTYTFRADRFGFSWYHSHYSAQYAAGLLGPMIIYGPTNEDYDIDIGPVFITDWYHKEYFDLLKEIMGTNQDLWDAFSQNNLINGMGNYDCSLVTDDTPCEDDAPNAQFSFKQGKIHRLRLVNAGAEGFEYFSIDGHEMTVIANDFVPVEPYKTKVVTLGIGQRTDVLVHGTGKPHESYWMRANNSLICGQTTKGSAVAEIHYEHSDHHKPPKSTPWPFTDVARCNNDDLEDTIPYYPVPGIGEPEVTQVLSINKTVNATGHQVWEVNNVSFRGNYNHPLLLLAQEGNVTYPHDEEWNVYNFDNNGTVRLIINNESPDETRLSHPLHLHGHEFFVVAEGEGRWDGHTIVRPENPQRRDTQMLRRAGYVVLDIVLDNPGVWPFHCHIAWHVSEGFYINIMEQPDKLQGSREIADIMSETCDAWNEYTDDNVVDQIDSGLREPMGGPA